MERRASIARTTAETSISAELCLDGSGRADVSTGIPFLDHILKTLAFHSKFDLGLRASGDLQHHTIEDVAIVLGSAISKALGDRSGIRRFGYALIPMDEALAAVSVDLAKRAFASINLKLEGPYVEGIHKYELVHFFRSLINSMEATVHIDILYGEDDHHKVEAATKALAISLRDAVRLEAERGYESVKGLL